MIETKKSGGGLLSNLVSSMASNANSTAATQPGSGNSGKSAAGKGKSNGQVSDNLNLNGHGKVEPPLKDDNVDLVDQLEADFADESAKKTPVPRMKKFEKPKT